MASFLTPNRHGYGVRFSRFQPDYIAVATSQFFGLAGGGTLFLLELTSTRKLMELQQLHWGDGLFDLAWSESDPTVLVTASGDGSLQVWNFQTPSLPPHILKEHSKEVYSVDWGKMCNGNLIISASWDSTVKVWDPFRNVSLNTYKGHTRLVYNAMWSPYVPNYFASVSGDGSLRLWNSVTPHGATAICKAHNAEVLSCDWSKHDQNIIATGGSDGLINIWDIRNFTQPVSSLQGCEVAVRRVQFSPHHLSLLASVSYDFTTKIWDFKHTSSPLETIQHHSEFVYGLDWNPHRKGELADCGWDSLVHVFSPISTRAHRL